MGIDIELVATDLDGTLLNNEQEIEPQDIETLEKLEKKGILRVIATGRNFFSLKKIIPKDFPLDYIIFSSGAGIFDWKNYKLIHSEYLPREKVKQIANFLIEENLDFMIQEVIPENHKFVYYNTREPNPDFLRRYEMYKEHATPLNPDTEKYEHASQIIVIPGKSHDYYLKLAKQLNGTKCIRTTSPLDGESLWVEIFPENVSKGHGLEWLCNHTNTESTKTIGIGNDYNDLDLLEFTGHSFAVDNAPVEIKKVYNSCKSNLECGFSDAVKKIMNL
ncbi:MAG: Cof-type HAD-IIB family hydrolase [Bacteroidales bacterium]